MNINELIKECHQNSVDAGWWDGCEERDLPTKLCLIHSELSEALHGVMADAMDDHLPDRSMEEVEMADTAIRICDYMGYRGFCYPPSLKVRFRYYPRASNIAEIHKSISCAMEGLRKGNKKNEEQWLGHAIKQVVKYCEINNLDLEGAIKDKMAYNKNRADHKRENRAKEGGKKF